MNHQDKINHIKTNFPMIVLLKKLKILPSNFNIKYRFPCPVHQGQNPTCCHINDHNQIHCWKCGCDYDIIDVYREIRQIKSFSEAIQRIDHFMKSNEFKRLIHQEKTTNNNSPNPFKQQHNAIKSKHLVDEKEIN
ncbi:CHC2 zinc finger domain-containing protein, partial [Poinsettia branch-inducing phytoplasma]|uniref:CHC2 zinc finger domain-containing protein n=1 Tax=Poinsettia branch-inducing phytoplasma TaxID=138647 RepID=UPI000366C186